MDVQIIIVILAAIVSVAFLARIIFRSKDDGGCGCGSECPLAKRANCASHQEFEEK